MEKQKEMHTRKVRQSAGDRAFGIFNTLLLIVFCLFILFPLIHMLAVSFSSGMYVLRGEVLFLPKGLTLDTYRSLLSDNSIPHAYWNTIRYTVLGTLLAVFMTSLCAYPLSRPKFFGRNFFNFLVVFTMLFNVGMVANFMVVYSLGLKNTIYAILFPTAINVYNMVIMRTFFQNIPEELYESANLDGANDLRTYLQIILPISKPVIASMVLFYAVGKWNEFMPALLYMDNKVDFPMQLILRNIVLSSQASSASADTQLVSQGIKYAAIFITIAPILAVYPFLQRFFTKGIMIGSLKG